MSYARFTENDVYVFYSVMNCLTCCGCMLGDKWDYYSTQAMVDHLEDHIAAGHDILPTLIPSLWQDDKINFPNSENDPE